jgi:hypothetical protein
MGDGIFNELLRFINKPLLGEALFVDANYVSYTLVPYSLEQAQPQEFSQKARRIDAVIVAGDYVNMLVKNNDSVEMVIKAREKNTSLFKEAVELLRSISDQLASFVEQHINGECA